MTLGPLALLSLVLAPLALGAGALRAIGVSGHGDRLAHLAFALVAGAVGTALVLFGGLLLDARPDARWAVPVVLAAGALLAVLGRRRARAAEPLPPAAAWERAAFGTLVLIAFALSTGRAVDRNAEPMVRGDGTYIFGNQAKVLFHAGGLNEELGALLARGFVRAPDYPLLNPLLQTWAHAHAGEIVHVEARIPIQVLGIALFALLAASLRRRVRPAVAGVLVLLVATTDPSRAYGPSAMSDALVALGALAALEAWLRYREEPQPRWLGLHGIALAFLAWTKHEGAMLAVVLLLAEGIAVALRAAPRPPVRTALASLLPLAAVLALGRGYNAAFALSSDLLGANPEGASFPVVAARHFAERWRTVAGWFVRDVWLDPANTRLLWLGVAASLALFPLRLARGRMLVPTLLLAGGTLGFALAILGTPRFPFEGFWHATVRVTHYLVPSAAVWLALAMAEIFPRAAPAGAKSRS